MDDWQKMGLFGAIFAALALMALYGDRRRMRRSDPDAVGVMPWTTIFFLAMFVACVTLGVAVREWFAVA
ncbi:MAG: hypothetical protein KGL48_05890 [Sphingomonadales bacterium]|nr:hypothetical protein [Sphingomonadales bacterium]MDE2569964.1 hypothetical protein [Sphingomonadales bacterium]